MKCFQIKLIEGVKNFFILHKLWAHDKSRWHNYTHLSTAFLYVVCEYFCHMSSLHALVLDLQKYNLWLVHCCYQALQAFHKTRQQGFRLIITNTFQRNWKSAKTINCTKYSHSPPRKFYTYLMHFFI